MSIDQFAALAGGLACLAVSIKAIANREIAMHLDDEDEPGLWLYGWRAVAVGCAWVILALLCFSVATGVIPSTWSSGPHGD